MFDHIKQFLILYKHLIQTKNIYSDSYYGYHKIKALHDKNYNFVLSFKSNCPTWLFKDHLHKKLKKNE